MSLFNGKNTTGWQRAPKHPDAWVVEGGTLVGRPSPGGLNHERTFANFRLRLEILLGKEDATFLSFRRPPGRATHAYRLRIGGNQEPADEGKTVGLHELGYNLPPFTGKLLRTAPGFPVKPGEWFRLEVIADGRLIVVLVNDTKVIEYTAPDDRISSGNIAILPETSSVVRVRKIEIKELPPTKPAGEKPPE